MVSWFDPLEIRLVIRSQLSWLANQPLLQNWLSKDIYFASPITGHPDTTFPHVVEKMSFHHVVEQDHKSLV